MVHRCTLHRYDKATCSRRGIKHVGKRYWVMSTEIAHFILAVNLNFLWGKHALWERISKGLLENLIPTPKDTAERQKWVSSVGLRKRHHLWRQNSNSNLNVGISNKLLPAIKFLPTKSVRCKTGLFWPDFLTGLVKKIHQLLRMKNGSWD
jgi:hypothetical protein